MRPWSRSCKAAGAVMLGKTNMDEFAMGSSNETSYYGPVRNPWDTDQGARRLLGRLGGGGRGAARAGATGTDTGGSIRQPAALTRRHRHQADLRRACRATA